MGVFPVGSDMPDCIAERWGLDGGGRGTRYSQPRCAQGRGPVLGGPDATIEKAWRGWGFSPGVWEGWTEQVYAVGGF